MIRTGELAMFRNLVDGVRAIPASGAARLGTGTTMQDGASAGLGTIDRLDTPIYALVVLLGLFPIWSTPWFPTVDGPIHLYIVFLLDKLADPDAASFRRVFEYNRAIDPNLTVYGVVWLLSRAMPMLTAEKVFVSLYWLSFAGAARYAVGALNGRQITAALLLLPLAIGAFLHWGFYNFVLSQALFLFVTGYAIRNLERLTAGRMAVLCLLTLGLALTHLMGVVMFCVYIGLYRLGIALRDWREEGPGNAASIGHRLVLDALRLLVTALPALILIASFVMRRMVGDVDSGLATADTFGKIRQIAQIEPIYGVDRLERIAYLPYTATVWSLLGVLAWALIQGRLRWQDVVPSLAPPIVLGGLFLLGSVGFANFDALARVLPFMFIMLILALGAVSLSSSWQWIVTVAVSVGLIGVISLRVPFYRQLNVLYSSVSAQTPPLPRGAAIVDLNTVYEEQMVAGHQVGWRKDLTEHFGERMARERELVLLNNDLMERRLYGYFPVRYRDDATIAAALRASGFTDYLSAFSRFQQTTGLPICQIRIWPRAEDLNKVYVTSIPERQDALAADLRAGWRETGGMTPTAPTILANRTSCLALQARASGMETR